MSNALHQPLSTVLADTYALYLKTQNFHWHVRGMEFASLHALFETQYTDLATAVDDIAERIIILNGKAPATFTALNKLSSIEDGDSHAAAKVMVTTLAADQDKVIATLNAALKVAQEHNDEGSMALLSDRISVHEKARWMLSASAA